MDVRCKRFSAGTRRRARHTVSVVVKFTLMMTWHSHWSRRAVAELASETRRCWHRLIFSAVVLSVGRSVCLSVCPLVTTVHSRKNVPRFYLG